MQNVLCALTDIRNIIILTDWTETPDKRAVMVSDERRNCFVAAGHLARHKWAVTRK